MKNNLIIAILFFTAVTSGNGFANQQSSISELCVKGSNMPQKVCSCMGEKSSSLTEQERTMLIAMLSKDKATAKKLRTTMPVNSQLATTMFFVNTPNECAKELGID